LTLRETDNPQPERSFEKVRKFKVQTLSSFESKLSVYPAEYTVVADSLKATVSRLPL